MILGSLAAVRPVEPGMYKLICIVVKFAYLKSFANILEAVATEFRDKREHGHGVTGPVHTFVKTDPHAHFKWGVRHHVGHHYAGRR